jgi:hypothetical protein
MVKFLFTVGQRVKEKANGKVGTVEFCSTEPTMDTPFYQARFDDGTIRRIAESDLSPA